jgi:hypothetical protein
MLMATEWKSDARLITLVGEGFVRRPLVNSHCPKRGSNSGFKLLGIK